MKFTSLLFFGLMATLFGACKKDSKEPDPEPGPSYCTPFPTSSPTRSVLYVNNFFRIDDDLPSLPPILGNSIQEDSLLNWCMVQGFTELILQSIGRVLDADSASYLNDFVCKARSAPYGLKVNFMAPSSARVNQIGTYCANYPNKPDGIITEYEFWNEEDDGTPGSFGTFLTILSAMTDVHETYPSVNRYAYVGCFRDDAEIYTEEYITQHLILNCEVIFLVNYEENAYHYNPSTSFSNQLMVLGENAQQISTPANVIIPFNVCQFSSADIIFSYFSVDEDSHEFVDAYNNLMNQYNDNVDEDSDGLSFKGYAIFHHTDARVARP